MSADAERLAMLGRFRLVRELGRGGMGVVHEAIDGRTGAAVALKTLPHLDPEALYRLRHEFRAVAGIEHPNLVRFGELGCEAGQWFLTMELVRGENFVAYVRRGRSWSGGQTATVVVPTSAGTDSQTASATGALETPQRKQIAWFDEQRLRSCLPQVVDALARLHEAGRAHRDVKPGNVLVSDRAAWSSSTSAWSPSCSTLQATAYLPERRRSWPPSSSRAGRSPRPPIGTRWG